MSQLLSSIHNSVLAGRFTPNIRVSDKRPFVCVRQTTGTHFVLGKLSERTHFLTFRIQQSRALMYAPSLVRPPPECRLGDSCPHFAIGQCRFAHAIPGAPAVSASSWSAAAAVGGASAAMPVGSSAAPCRYGAACTRQATCRYRHPLRPPGVPVACRFGANCARRSECRFTHPAADAAAAAASSDSALAMLVPENALYALARKQCFYHNVFLDSGHQGFSFTLNFCNLTALTF